MGPNPSYITPSNPPLDNTNTHTQETIFSVSSESMVSLQGEMKAVSPNLEAFPSSRKRKWQDQGEDDQDQHETKRQEPMFWQQAHHLDAPLPLEWQRCLDIKSGQIHFYNTRTHKRTSKDPRSSPEPNPSPSRSLSLDLELNLNVTCNQRVETERRNSGNKISWISLDADERQEEMVAAVCRRCHMLVMMRKATPSCPNCKFVHPQGQSSSPWLNNKLGFRLLCCKD